MPRTRRAPAKPTRQQDRRPPRHERRQRATNAERRERHAAREALLDVSGWRTSEGGRAGQCPVCGAVSEHLVIVAQGSSWQLRCRKCARA
jgi:hypothetical protein